MGPRTDPTSMKIPSRIKRRGVVADKLDIYRIITASIKDVSLPSAARFIKSRFNEWNRLSFCYFHLKLGWLAGSPASEHLWLFLLLGRRLRRRDAIPGIFRAPLDPRDRAVIFTTRLVRRVDFRTDLECEIWKNILFGIAVRLRFVPARFVLNCFADIFVS